MYRILVTHPKDRRPVGLPEDTILAFKEKNRQEVRV
jgi:hypothetical protein